VPAAIVPPAFSPLVPDDDAMARTRAPQISLPEAAVAFRLLGDTSRLRLLLHLSEHGETCVGDLGRALHQSQTTVSHHLMLLRRGGLVEYRRDGKQNFYRVRSPLVTELLGLVENA
jgi:ArsR family transcriptional regulator